MAVNKKTKSVNKKLSPTENAFQHHLLGIAYQLMIWHQAVHFTQNLPDSIDYGYKVIADSILQPIWLTQEVSPPELQSQCFCDCVENPCSIVSTCIINNQSCTATYAYST